MGSLRVNSALGVSHVTLLFALACGDTSDATVIDASVDSTNDVVTDGPHAPPGCDLKADPKDSLACVDGSVGVFVDSAGKDSNDGSKANPVATLGAAFLLANQKGLPRVYVCEGKYTESATMTTSVSIYGGFKCGAYAYSGNKPQFGGAKADYVLKLDGVSNVTVEDMEFDAKDGAMPGESSIAMLVNASQGVTLTSLKLSGGAGVTGTNGTLTNYTFKPDPAPNGNNASGDNGGTGVGVACPGGDSTLGGQGGTVSIDPKTFGGDAGLPSLGGGGGGMGSGGACASGGDGANGSNGDAGTGALTNGTLAQAWASNAGVSGGPGGAGQGGGGGGANTKSLAQHGGGGSGGAGGCGGAGGGGGKGGGSSFGLVSVGSSITVAKSAIGTKGGGSGGAGVAGQSGQTPGGLGGLQSPPGCPGGSGGAGGNGGAGGGGAGGLSVGVFYKGTPPTVDMATSGAITLGTAGQGGAGGASNKGVDGIAAPVAECKSPLCN